MADAQVSTADYFDYYNHERLHPGIDYQTPYHTHQQLLQLKYAKLYSVTGLPNCHPIFVTMNNLFIKALRVAGYVLGSTAAVLLLYVTVAYVLALIPVAAESVPPGGPRIPVYLYTPNGVHTDLVLPVRTTQMDWSRELKFAQTSSRDSIGYDYVAIGWGDKGFYYIPGWSDLTLPIAFRAAFHLGTTAMHTTFHKASELQLSATCVRLELTPVQYAKLVAYAQNSFRRDTANHVQYLPGHTYAGHDAFYEGEGAYSFWHTCNSWADDGLKASGQRAALWTPFSRGLFRHYAP